MVKFAEGILCMCIAVALQPVKCTKARIVNSREVVDSINSNPKSTWKVQKFELNIQWTYLNGLLYEK